MYALKGQIESQATPVEVTLMTKGQQSFRSAAYAVVKDNSGDVFTVPVTWIFNHRPRLTKIVDAYGECTVWTDA